MYSVVSAQNVISIHALREEGDPCKFHRLPDCRYFNPRPPRGGRLCALGVHPAFVDISIHALREEGDCILNRFKINRLRFQSTPSARRATDIAKALQLDDPISIHALREEGDFFEPVRVLPAQNFNPRPPRGGRPRRKSRSNPWSIFQSTPSARRATPHHHR